MATKTERARPRNREETAASLRKAAMSVFAAQGYDAATTREVARVAGVSEQLIQRYFGGKAGLLLSIMELYTERDRAGAFGTPPEGNTVEEEIKNILMFHLERERRNGDFARVAIYRAIVDPKVAAQVGRMFVESREPQIFDRLVALQSRGAVRPDANLRALAHVLSTLSFGLAFNDQLIFRRKPAALEATIAGFAQTMSEALQPTQRVLKPVKVARQTRPANKKAPA
jgi:AcrR family transcriptional regulator